MTDFWQQNGLMAAGLVLSVLCCRLPRNGWLAAGLTMVLISEFGLAAVFC
jgi:hypothetical protein